MISIDLNIFYLQKRKEGMVHKPQTGEFHGTLGSFSRINKRMLVSHLKKAAEIARL